jgi:hypothetical protein
MSEAVSLRRYFERVLKEMDRRYQQRFESQERALKESKTTTDTRLSGMNEFRLALSDSAGKYVTRKECVAFVVAACAVTGVLIEIASYFTHK